MSGAIAFLLLVFGCGLLVAASEFHNAWTRILARIIGSAFLLVVLAFLALIAPYFWASHLESKWTAARPTTKAQLEACLSLYTASDIQPSYSLWGHRYELGPGQRMTQYGLLYVAPLDA